MQQQRNDALAIDRLLQLKDYGGTKSPIEIYGPYWVEEIIHDIAICGQIYIKHLQSKKDVYSIHDVREWATEQLTSYEQVVKECLRDKETTFRDTVLLHNSQGKIEILEDLISAFRED